MQITLKDDNLRWQRVKTVTHTAVELSGEQLSIGFTDLGGNLDILDAAWDAAIAGRPA
jgi:hypothetical protein